MTFALVCKLVLVASIFLTVLALALRANAADAFYLLRNWRLGLRSFTSMFIVVPLVAVVLAAMFDIKPEVKIAILALALSPIPPRLPGKQVKAGGHGSYITGLLVAAALVSLVLTPLGIMAFTALFSADATVHAKAIWPPLAITIGLPILTGFLLQRVCGEHSQAASQWIGKVASVMFLVAVIVLLVQHYQGILAVIGDGTIVVLLAMIGAGLLAGLVLGGEDADNRTTLALASAARHPGVAIAIVTSSFPGARLAPAAILLFAALNVVATIPLMRKAREDADR